MCGIQALALVILQALSALGETPVGSNGAKPPKDVVKALVAATDPASGVLWGYQVLHLLYDAGVQRELAITPEQRAAIGRLGDAYLDVAAPKPKARPKREKEEKIWAEERERRHKQASESLKQSTAKAVALLTSEQKQRLLQVVLQLRSVEILFYPEVASALGLSESQKADLARLRPWIMEEARKLHKQFMGKTRDRKAFDEGVDRVMDEAKKRALGMLTQEQRAAMAAMEGAKIGFARRHLNLVIRKSRPSGTGGKDGPPTAPETQSAPARGT